MKTKGFTLLEVMMASAISAMVFAAVLSAYIFLGRGLARLGYDSELESRSHLAVHDFIFDVSQSSGLAGTPTSSQFTVNVILQVVNPNLLSPPANSVTGTATYTYSASAGTITLLRSAPIARSNLQASNWPTQDINQPANPLLLLKGMQPVQNLGLYSGGYPFAYFQGPIMPTPASPNPQWIMVPYPPNPNLVKFISLSFTTAWPPQPTTAQASLSGSSWPIMMRNKGYLH